MDQTTEELDGENCLRIRFLLIFRAFRAFRLPKNHQESSAENGILTASIFIV